MSEQLTGRELDAAIAEQIFGWFPPADPRGTALLEKEEKGLGYIGAANKWWVTPTGYGTSDLPHYSTEIKAAWHVMEKMHELGFRCSVGEVKSQWRAAFLKSSPIRPMPVIADAPSAELAICRAALAAIDAK